MVEDASDGTHFIWTDIGKCEDGTEKKGCCYLVADKVAHLYGYRLNLRHALVREIFTRYLSHCLF